MRRRLTTASVIRFLVAVLAITRPGTKQRLRLALHVLCGRPLCYRVHLSSTGQMHWHVPKGKGPLFIIENHIEYTGPPPPPIMESAWRLR